MNKLCYSILLLNGFFIGLSDIFSETEEVLSDIEKKNKVLENETKQLYLQLEYQKKKKELEDFEKDKQHADIIKDKDRELDKIKKEIEILQNKLMLYKEKTNDTDEFRKLAILYNSLVAKNQLLEQKLRTLQQENEVSKLEMDNNNLIRDCQPEYLDDPLQKDGTLVLSDRMIKMDIIVNSKLAEKVEQDIDFFNNKDSKKPIFLVFDVCFGGDTFAGARILNKMKSSKAPVYVVVKSFAASMAAIITTCAEKSFCYKQTVILHHQPSVFLWFERLNIVRSKELVETLEKNWKQFMDPVCKKMGINMDTFIKKMYTHNSDGDWSEYGEEAQKLKWVDNVISNIRDTSVKIRYNSKWYNEKFKSNKEELVDIIERYKRNPSGYYMFISESILREYDIDIDNKKL